MDEFCKLNQGFDTDAIRNAMEYAAECHNGTNHKYDTHPYTIHLKMVYDFGCKFAHLLNADEVDSALAACWTHDTIEDTRQTYNDVKKRCGETVAEAVYAVTNEKGRTRADRRFRAGFFGEGQPREQRGIRRRKEERRLFPAAVCFHRQGRLRP